MSLTGVLNAYIQAAIDIEASIHGTSLDIGVFGSRQRISQEGAIDLVDEIVSYLRELDDEDDAEMAAWASSWVVGNGKRAY